MILDYIHRNYSHICVQCGHLFTIRQLKECDKRSKTITCPVCGVENVR